MKACGRHQINTDSFALDSLRVNDAKSESSLPRFAYCAINCHETAKKKEIHYLSVPLFPFNSKTDNSPVKASA